MSDDLFKYDALYPNAAIKGEQRVASPALKVGFLMALLSDS